MILLQFETDEMTYYLCFTVPSQVSAIKKKKITSFRDFIVFIIKKTSKRLLVRCPGNMIENVQIET